MPTLRFNHKYAPAFDAPPAIRYIILTGGRGSGKSFALSAAMAARANQGTGWKILYTRYTITSAADSIIPEFMEKVDLMGLGDRFEQTGRDVENKSGSVLLFRGIKTSSGNQTAKLKSLQGVNVWVLDEAEELDDEDIFDTIDLSVRDSHHQNLVVLCLNPSHKKHWIYRRFFEARGVAPGFNGVDGDTMYVHTSYRDNRGNLPVQYCAIADNLREVNPMKWEHIWAGSWLDELEGALWNWNMIEDARCSKAEVPELERIVVGVDPAVTDSAKSDDTGIVVAGRGVDGHYYVLDDASLKASPLVWAQAACAAYRKWRADRIVAEVNNGGDLVELTLRQVDKQIPYSAVHASRGKTKRAEPIAALYEQGMVHHVGTFADMETEMMTFTGASNDGSPDHMDAMVWALTELSDGASVFVAGDDKDDDEGKTTDEDVWENEEAWG